MGPASCNHLALERAEHSPKQDRGEMSGANSVPDACNEFRNLVSQSLMEVGSRRGDITTDGSNADTLPSQIPILLRSWDS